MLPVRLKRLFFVDNQFIDRKSNTCSHLLLAVAQLLYLPNPISILFSHIFFTPKSIAMNTQKFLVSGIVAGVVSFFAGYLIYGLLLMDFFTKNAGSATGVNRAMGDMVWWAMIGGSIFMGLLLSYIFNKWASINTLSAGLTAGAVISFFMTTGTDLLIYGQTNLSTLTAVCVDIVAGTIMGAITGAVVGMMNGMGKKAS